MNFYRDRSVGRKFVDLDKNSWNIENRIEETTAREKIRSARGCLPRSSIGFNSSLKLFQTRHRLLSCSSPRRLSRPSSSSRVPSARDSRRSTRVQSRSNEPKMGEGGGKMKSYAVLSTLIGGQRARFERDLLIEEGEKKKKRTIDRVARDINARKTGCARDSSTRGVRTLERSKGGGRLFFLCNFVSRSFLMFCN